MDRGLQYDVRVNSESELTQQNKMQTSYHLRQTDTFSLLFLSFSLYSLDFQLSLFVQLSYIGDSLQLVENRQIIVPR